METNAEFYSDTRLINLLRKIAQTGSDGELLDEQLSEFDVSKDTATREANIFRLYAENHQGDVVGEMAGAMSLARPLMPLLRWNHDRLHKVAEIAVEIEKIILAADGEAQIVATMDPITGKSLIIHAKSGQYNPWGFMDGKMRELTSIMGKSDELTICPLEDEFFEVTFRFKDVREI